MGRTRPQQPKCINPDVGRKLYLQIRERAPNQEQFLLEGDLDEHMRTCPHCSGLAPLWIISAGGGIAASAAELLAEVKAGSQAVLHRSHNDGDVYFKPKTAGSLDGLLVKVARDGAIISVDEANIEAFNGN